MGELDPQSVGAMFTSAVALVSAGGAYGKSMNRLNRATKELEQIDDELSKLKAEQTDRLARLETKIDMLLNR